MGGSRSPSEKQGAAEQLAYSIPQFCVRNHISRPTYHRLRTEGRAPKEMRIGINLIRITAEAERNWQHLMQESAQDFENQATERAVKAGAAAAQSPTHVSKRSRRGHSPKATAQGDVDHLEPGFETAVVAAELKDLKRCQS